MERTYITAWRITYKNAVKAAGGALIPFAFLRVPVLTKVTSNMCSDIMKAYGYEQLKGIATFAGVATGAALGVVVANEILEKIPGLGTAAASASTALLHLGTGVFMISACELLKTDQITDEQLQNKAWCKSFTSALSSKAGDMICRLIRGQSPIEFAYEAFTS